MGFTACVHGTMRSLNSLPRLKLLNPRLQMTDLLHFTSEERAYGQARVHRLISLSLFHHQIRAYRSGTKLLLQSRSTKFDFIQCVHLFMDEVIGEWLTATSTYELAAKQNHLGSLSRYCRALRVKVPLISAPTVQD